MFRICGSIPASNFILIPKTTSQSLNLTGVFFFLIFKPLPSKFFVVHLEVVTSAGLVVRISFSNLFKEFKSTSTWLQFPFKTGSGDAGEGSMNNGCLDSTARWTFLSLNLREILSKYLFSNYSHLKNIKLCANVLVKNIFTSNLEYSPLVSGLNKSHYLDQVPREMALPLAKGMEFLDVYDYVCFPCEEKKLAVLNEHRRQLKGMRSEVVIVSGPKGEGTGYTSHVTKVDSEPATLGKSGTGGGDHVTKVNYLVVQDAGRSVSHVTSDSGKLADHMIGGGGGPEKEGGTKSPVKCWRTGKSGVVDVKFVEGVSRGRSGSEGGDSEGMDGVHVYAADGTEVTIHRDSDPKLQEKITLKSSRPTVSRIFLL